MNEAHSVAAEAEPSLRRSLGRWDLTAIGVNQVIGSAVFLVPAQIAMLVSGWSPMAMLLIGLASMPVALCFAEAGSRFEKTGGAYLYAKAAFGRFAGLEVAWMQWFTRVTAMASVANGIAVAFGSFYPAATRGTGRLVLISVVILTLMFVNLRGIRQSSNLINALTIAKLVPLAGFLVLAGWHIHSSYYPPLSTSPEHAAQAALLLVFTFGGFDVIGVQAGEARTPQSDVPVALVVVIFAVTLIFTAIQTLLMFTVPDLAHSQTPLADAGRIVAGPAGTVIVAAGAILSMIGTNQGQVLSGSRTLYALAENGELPAFLARINRHRGIPANAIILTAAAGLALALSGSFVRMAAMSAVARLAAYVATAAAVLVLRRKEANGRCGAAEFRVPGGVLFPVLALTTCFLILAGATRDQLVAGAIALVGGAILHLAAPKGGRTDGPISCTNLSS